ncbi:MAG TPA: LolA-related protein [Burkholderiaceae bacterium]|nr:LolA-related protein [Burkholderiaceae bacterium]
MRLNLQLFMRLLACIAASVVALVATAAEPAAFDLDRLMRELSRNTAGSARFVETRTSSLLDRPLETAGELRYEAPGRFIKRTRTPTAETLTVDGTRVRIERGGKVRTADLDAYPEAMAIIDALRGTLLGDQRALERVFAVSGSGTAERWTLALLPTDPRLAKTISHVRVTGARREVLGIDVLYADGDRSSMRIEPITTP